MFRSFYTEARGGSGACDGWDNDTFTDPRIRTYTCVRISVFVVAITAKFYMNCLMIIEWMMYVMGLLLVNIERQLQTVMTECEHIMTL